MKEDLRPKNVIIHPGEVRSERDGDRHYIGVGQLIQLYGVVEGLDRIVVAKRLHPIPYEQFMAEGWIDLYPEYDGSKYYNIHDVDRLPRVDFEKSKEKHRKSLNIPNTN